MDIHWLGHSCFRIKGKEAVIITDPCHPDTGYSIGKLRADIVTVSHEHPGHSYTEAMEDEFREIRRPGEYELKNVFITGSTTFHDAMRGKERGKNTAFVFEIDGITVCHLGDIGHVPSEELKENISQIDILFLPVGGISTIGSTTAAEIVRRFVPRIIIPMHYKTPLLSRELEPVDKFLKEMGVKDQALLPKFSVTRSGLPSTAQIVVFNDPQ